MQFEVGMLRNLNVCRGCLYCESSKGLLMRESIKIGWMKCIATCVIRQEICFFKTYCRTPTSIHTRCDQKISSICLLYTVSAITESTPTIILNGLLWKISCCTTIIFIYLKKNFFRTSPASYKPTLTRPRRARPYYVRTRTRDQQWIVF